MFVWGVVEQIVLIHFLQALFRPFPPGCGAAEVGVPASRIASVVWGSSWGLLFLRVKGSGFRV